MSSPIRERGNWGSMSPAERDDLTNRGLGQVFDPTLREGVLTLIEDVRAHGDDALVRALRTFDNCDVLPDRIRVQPDEFVAARDALSDEMIAAIRNSIEHVRRFNEELVARHGDWSFETAPGVTVGEKVTAIESVGLFVPSGKGSYPSVLVQLLVPAVVAGVETIAIIVPPVPGSDGKVDDAVLVVADELGVHDVFRSNGPAGIAALAFGTESVPRVRLVCGPGSPPVSAAQVEVQRFGTVGVMLLGPSESLILADDSADPYLLAADLLNEAEHGPDSSSVLVTDSPSLLAAAQDAVEHQLAELPTQRADYARRALGVNGGAVLVTDMAEGAQVANTYAPEHMQLVVRDEDAVLARIEHAGEVLLGQFTTMSMANFVIGCPASLPTSGYAKVSSGITASTFRKRTAVAKSNLAGLEQMSQTVIAFTQHEGFPAHELAVTRRLHNP